jgi:hypothetical protein
MCRIKRAYITNDGANFYVRVDNAQGTFSRYRQQPLFALCVYSQDFCNGNPPSTSLGASGQPLRRPMSYMVERRSDSDGYRRWSVSGGQWAVDRTIDWVIAPQ